MYTVFCANLPAVDFSFAKLLAAASGESGSQKLLLLFDLVNVWFPIHLTHRTTLPAFASFYQSPFTLSVTTFLLDTVTRSYPVHVAQIYLHNRLPTF